VLYWRSYPCRISAWGGPSDQLARLLFRVKPTKIDHPASLLQNITIFHSRKSNIVVFSQTIGQKNTSIFQNCPLLPHTGKKIFKNKKVSQSGSKNVKTKILCCFGITSSRAVVRNPNNRLCPVIIEHTRGTCGPPHPST
jgi:hypothetical protein